MRSMNVLFTVLILIVPCGVVRSDEAIRPARQLIKEVQSLCNDPDEKYGSILADLAEAYVYLGDIPAARAILGEYKNDFWNQIGYQTCAALEAELTGRMTILPSAVWNDDPDFTHWWLAIAHAKRGDSAKALEHFNNLPITRAGIVQLYGRKLVEPLVAVGDREAARRVLSRWAECFSKADSISAYHGPETPVEHDLKVLVEVGERERAIQFCEHWQELADRERDIDAWGEIIGMSWARLGASWSAVGEKEKAMHAFRKSTEWLEVARLTAFDPTKRTDGLDFAVAFTVAAARQKLALGVEAAQPTYERAYEMAARVTATDFQEFGYVKIVREQLKAGDLNGIPETMKRMVVLRDRSEAWREISRHYLEHGDKPRALMVARAAGAELDRDDLEMLVARETANIAECLAKAGDEEFAKRLFRRAIALSERHEDSKFDHQWIGGQQVGAGFLVDAYATIKAIPEPQTRLIPLAELAKAAARLEATGQRR